MSDQKLLKPPPGVIQQDGPAIPVTMIGRDGSHYVWDDDLKSLVLKRSAEEMKNAINLINSPK